MGQPPVHVCGLLPGWTFDAAASWGTRGLDCGLEEVGVWLGGAALSRRLYNHCSLCGAVVGRGSWLKD